MWRRYEAVSFKVFPPSTSSYTMYTCSLIIVYEKKRPNFFFYYCFFFFDLYWRLLREKVCLTRVSKVFRTWKRIGYRRGVKIIFVIIFLFLLEIGVKKKFIFTKIGIHLILIYLLYEKGNASKRMCFPDEKICDFSVDVSRLRLGIRDSVSQQCRFKVPEQKVSTFCSFGFTKKYVLVKLFSIYEKVETGRLSGFLSSFSISGAASIYPNS